MGLLGQYAKLTYGPRHTHKVRGLLLQNYHKCTFSNKISFSRVSCVLANTCTFEFARIVRGVQLV
jgi:hypothetical protein